MSIIYLIIALAVCISVHECAHAWMAYQLGDPTAKMAGRVTLNPLKHLSFFGTIMIFIAHFGWSKPVPFNYYNLKNPRRDTALIAIAGPLSNLLTAIAIAVPLKYISFHPFIETGLWTIFNLSIILFLFNLIPLSPLDGSKLIGLFVPASGEMWYRKFLSQGQFYIILLIIGDRILANVSGFSILGTYLAYGYELIAIPLRIGT